MSEIIERIIFKANRITVEQYEVLQMFYDLPDEEMINMVLRAFISVTVTLVGQNKSLYFYVGHPLEIEHAHTISWFLISPLNKNVVPEKFFEHAMKRREMSMFKKSQSKAMLRSASETFAAAVEMCTKITKLQLAQPAGILVSSEWGSKAFYPSSINLDVNKALEERGLHAVPLLEPNKYVLRPNKKIKKEE